MFHQYSKNKRQLQYMYRNNSLSTYEKDTQYKLPGSSRLGLCSINTPNIKTKHQYLYQKKYYFTKCNPIQWQRYPISCLAWVGPLGNLPSSLISPKVFTATWKELKTTLIFQRAPSFTFTKRTSNMIEI